MLPITCPLRGEFTDGWWISFHKGLVNAKMVSMSWRYNETDAMIKPWRARHFKRRDRMCFVFLPKFGRGPAASSLVVWESPETGASWRVNNVAYYRPYGLYTSLASIYKPVALLHKSHNAAVPYPTMHHFVTEMCTCVHISVTKWCFVGYLPDAFWVLCDGFIRQQFSRINALTPLQCRDWDKSHPCLLRAAWWVPGMAP